MGLGTAAALTLILALLRYAIDLLGVVFVIILVGFAIRALSDWMTEGQAVSVWAITALSMGLFGTVLVGLWLVSSTDSTNDGIQAPLPGLLSPAVAWMESQGWGRRVLLPGSSVSGSMGGAVSGDRSGGGSAPPVETSTPAEPVAMAPPRTEPSERGAGAVARLKRASPAGRTSPDQAEAAERPAPSVVPPPAAESPSVSPTTLTLVASPSPVVVGRSVRLTARVNADGNLPTGVVIFSADDHVLGRAPVRDGVAVLVTLDLELGDHLLSAAYEGDGTHLPSRSESISQTVSRK